MSKKANRFEIFISYRRKGGYDTAKLIYDRLRIDGYSVSFDIDTLINGNFDTELENRVNECKDFLLVLSPGIFDRFFTDGADYNPEDDWVRREIACAIKSGKNIVPLALDGFVFPKTLPDDVKGILNKNAIDLYPKYFEAAYAKMKSFLISKPYWVVRHKRKLISSVIVAILVIAAFFISQINHELEETKSIAEEKINALDSVGSTLDSIQQEIKRRQELRSQARTYYWNGTEDGTSQAIFEKLQEVGFQKTECSGRGLVVTPNKANCREDAKDSKAKKFTCFYSPRITFTTCDNRPYTFLEKNKRLRSSPQASEEAAREELLNELRNMDFSDWISEIKNFR